MAIVTEVRFAHEDGALADTLNEHPDIDAVVIREAGTDPGHDIELLRVEGADPDAIEAILADDHTVEAVRPMPGFEDRRLVGVEFAEDAHLLAPEVTSRDGFVLEARSASPGGGLRGWYERWLLPDGDALHDIWQQARDEGYDFEVLELRQPGRGDPGEPGPDALTAQQREALVAAFEQGYFKEPRETSLEELAESLDLSPTAVAGRLRRGMKKLIGITLLVDDRKQ